MEETIQSKPSFDLLDDPWVMVELPGGATEKLGLFELFERAPEIRRIVGEMPQMQIVTIRLCEAILYRCLAVPGLTEKESWELWIDLWKQRRIPEEVYREYLLANRSGFNLFGSRPFYQTVGLEFTKADPLPMNYLVPDIPKADKFLFSMRSINSINSLSFDEAARYLLLTQGFDTGGIKSPVKGNTHIKDGKVHSPKDMVQTGWCGALGGTYLEGCNFFETLMLNLVLFDSRIDRGSLLGIEGDIPPWERDGHFFDWVERDPVGPVDILTWQNRRIRLVPDDSGKRVSGVVLCYGDVAKPIDKQGVEMMTPWMESTSDQKKWSLPYVPWIPKKHDPSKSIWRGLSSLIAYDASGNGVGRDMRPGIVRWVESIRDHGEDLLEDGYPLMIHTQGIVYDKPHESKYVDSIDDSISLCTMMLRHDAEAQREMLDVILAAEDAVNAFSSFVGCVLVSRGDHRRFVDEHGAELEPVKQCNKNGQKKGKRDDDAKVVMKDCRERAYTEFDDMFRERIAHFTPQEPPVEYCAAWRRDIHRTIIRLAEDFLGQSDVSCFSGGEWGAGRSFNVLCARLTKQLGPLAERSQDPSDK